MTVEELLKPRWQVIADYPGSDYHIGEILDLDWGWVGNDEIGFKHHISHYHNLFKKLEWWEERAGEDFLELKFSKTIAGNSVRKVLRLELHWNKILLDGGKVKPISHWLPATEEEYRAFNVESQTVS
jgi:hypothetical protein